MVQVLPQEPVLPCQHPSLVVPGQQDVVVQKQGQLLLPVRVAVEVPVIQVMVMPVLADLILLAVPVVPDLSRDMPVAEVQAHSQQQLQVYQAQLPEVVAEASATSLWPTRLPVEVAAAARWQFFGLAFRSIFQTLQLLQLLRESCAREPVQQLR